MAIIKCASQVSALLLNPPLCTPTFVWSHYGSIHSITCWTNVANLREAVPDNMISKLFKCLFYCLIYHSHLEVRSQQDNIYKATTEDINGKIILVKTRH